MSSLQNSCVVRRIVAPILALTVAGLSGCEDEDAPALAPEPAGVPHSSALELSIPDSDWAREVAEAGFADQPEWMQNHLMRTYSFGALLLRAQGRSFDPELAFAAAMLHDLGLVERHISSDRRFEIDGADAAARCFVSEHGRSSDESERVWQAVALHLYPHLAAHVPAEVSLVALGAAADAVGLGLDQLAAADVDEVLAAYPRLGFKENSIAGIISQCERKPLAYALHPWVEVGREHIEGFMAPTVEDLIRAAPFAD
jgi:hypothetical protein